MKKSRISILLAVLMIVSVVSPLAYAAPATDWIAYVSDGVSDSVTGTIDPGDKTVNLALSGAIYQRDILVPDTYSQWFKTSPALFGSDDKPITENNLKGFYTVAALNTDKIFTQLNLTPAATDDFTVVQTNEALRVYESPSGEIAGNVKTASYKYSVMQGNPLSFLVADGSKGNIKFDFYKGESTDATDHLLTVNITNNVTISSREWINYWNGSSSDTENGGNINITLNGSFYSDNIRILEEGVAKSFRDPDNANNPSNLLDSSGKTIKSKNSGRYTFAALNLKSITDEFPADVGTEVYIKQTNKMLNRTYGAGSFVNDVKGKSYLVSDLKAGTYFSFIVGDKSECDDITFEFYKGNSDSGNLLLTVNITNNTTITVGRPPTSGGTPAGTDTIPVGDEEIKYGIDSNGTVTVSPTRDQIDKIIKDSADEDTIVFDFSDVEGVKELVFDLESSWFNNAGKDVTFIFGNYSLLVEDGMFDEIYKLTKGKVRFGLEIGSVKVSISQNGKEIDWYNFKTPMTVSMPYTPPQDISTHQLVMIDAEKNIIPRSWYVAKSGSPDGVMYAKVYETGTFDVKVAEMEEFTDVEGLWMAEAVGYAAARGIIEGTGENLFSRDGTITRAHYVTLLMRALDVELEAEEDALPADFDESPEWAKPHIETAAALGLTITDDDGNFDPEAPIIRQDMFFMTYEAIEAFGMLPLMFTSDWIVFTDWDGNVKDEYSDAIQNLCKMGLVHGNGDGTLNPNGESTRSHGAQFLYNFLKWDARQVD